LMAIAAPNCTEIIAPSTSPLEGARAITRRGTNARALAS
jgi:hypothetical protein